MADLSTKYMGLTLKNPIIVASSGLTDKFDKIAEIERNGAGAVVLKSIFEEQILLETEHRLEKAKKNSLLYAEHSETLDYLIQYSTNGGGAWTNIVTLPNQEKGARTYSWAVPNDASVNCMVKVTATDQGALTDSGQSASAFTITAAEAGLLTDDIVLCDGWNLMSLTLIPTCTAIESVLADLDLTTVLSVWHYDNCNAQWLSYTPGAPSDLTTMEDGKGYWIQMDAGGPYTLTIEGRAAPVPPGVPPEYTVYTGWNMIGFKSTLAGPVEDYLGGLDGKYDSLFGYDCAAIPPVYDYPGPAENMNPGWGYWIHIEADAGCDCTDGCDYAPGL